MPDNALARRMFLAMNALEQRRGSRVTLAQLGAMVAEAQQGREAAYAASVVARWIKGEQDPGSRDQWIALAAVLGVDPGWLTYGTGSMASALSGLDLDPSRDHRLTPEEEERALVQAQREREQSSTTKRGRKTASKRGKK